MWRSSLWAKTATEGGGMKDEYTTSGSASAAGQCQYRVAHATPLTNSAFNLPDQLSHRLAFRAQFDRPAVLGLVPGVQRHAQAMIDRRGQVLRGQPGYR